MEKEEKGEGRASKPLKGGLTVPASLSPADSYRNNATLKFL